MTAITGKEPFHWHAPDGNHRMTDPRTIPGWPERWWDSDEKSYVTHLQTHEEERSKPQRKTGDGPRIQGLFDLLEARETECRHIREMIVAQRELDAAKKALGI